MIVRARELAGRWVLVYRVNEPKASNSRRGGFDTVRTVAHLLDLGERSRSPRSRRSSRPTSAATTPWLRRSGALPGS